MSVYFIASTGHIKIGYSANPVKRSASITSGRPSSRPKAVPRNALVELIGWMPGDRRTERRIQGELDAYWVHGEWFTDCPPVRDYLLSRDDSFLLAGASISDVTAALSDGIAQTAPTTSIDWDVVL